MADIIADNDPSNVFCGFYLFLSSLIYYQLKGLALPVKIKSKINFEFFLTYNTPGYPLKANKKISRLQATYIYKNVLFYYIDIQNITLPYADDFCLITTDLRKHQKIQKEIKSKIESMGMRLKPAKCRSFCIRSGVPSRINFTIGETEIPNIFKKEQKFIGKLLFPTAHR